MMQECVLLGLVKAVDFIDEQKRALHDRICDTRVIKSGEL